MTTQSIAQAIPFSKILNLRLPKVKINFKLVLLLGFCLVLFLSVLYIFQVNRTVESGYLTRNYQSTLAKLIQKNKNLEVNLSKISYIENIEAKAVEMNFQRVSKIQYIQVLDSSLAQR